ncbi:MAG: thiamine-phosphate kinase [Kiritimatiellia bacterium]
MTRLGDLGEQALILRLTRGFKYHRGVVVGVGDDCAVVRCAHHAREDLLLTSDAVTEAVHFVRGTPEEKVGHKAIGRVLSDIAAMGGKPLWALINIAAPPDFQVERLDAFYRGALRLAKRFGMSIAGGDTSRARIFTAHLFAVGTVPSGRAVLRSGAQPGDSIFVTGALGGSILGKHLAFQPRLREGLLLRQWATAMIDISDGLATDLRHILAQSRVGALIELPAIPIAPAARRLRDTRSPLEHALCDGEDFELLFTIHPDEEQRFQVAWRRAFKLPCTRIGTITDRIGQIETKDAHGKFGTLKPQGYEHFTP